jgi:hypothetical protein
MEGIKDPDQLYPILFNSFKSAFNRKFDIKFYDIPVEVYIETADTEVVSNGIYSVKNDSWIQEPKNEAIPEIDLTEIDKALKPWLDRFEQLESDIEKGKVTSEEPIDDFITDLYSMREAGLRGKSKSEYSIENLAFKELRNEGYLDKLKAAKHELISKRLSLEETLTRQARTSAYNQLMRAAGTQPIIQDNGLFFIYNLKASEISQRLRALRALPFVVSAESQESGKYDFSNVLDLAMNKIPSKYYNIRGQIDETLI